jgi:penicillin-binding protein 1A
MESFRRGRSRDARRTPKSAWTGWRWKFRLLVVAPLVLGLLGTTAAGLLFVHYSLAFPDPLSLRHKERAPIIRILAADGSVLAERGDAHDYVPLDLIPRHVTDAVVATEDRRFYEHKGIDPWGLIRATFANIRARRYVQGGSTLTQQLAKNLFLTSERTLNRKLEEVALAFWLELRLGKADILELYLNRVYFGAGAYGIEAAAQRYFEKSSRNLTVGEAAVIAGLLKAPSKYSPLTSPGAARNRGRVVLKKMLAARVITPEAETEAARKIVKFASLKSSRDAGGAEYAVDYVLERLPQLLGSGHAEVIVETTIDAKLQRRAQTAVEQTLARDGESAQASQAAVVVLDTDGGIAALVGGRSYAESQYNRAVKSKRQPGSAFKPFVYLAALEAGMTPDTIVSDSPVSIDNWSPRNDNGLYRGPVTLRQGLAQSINTVAVRLQHAIGGHQVANTARRLGITSELRTGPSLALGTSETSLIEMTGSYTTFANGGRRIDPHIIKRVRISSGRVLYLRPPPPSKIAVAPVHVGAMNDMLNAALVTGTGRRASILLHPAAGKTGTTQEFRDAWFIGYTAHLTGGVWIGNDQGRTMNNVRGGSLPAMIWHDIMVAAHQGRAVVALPGTSTVTLRPRDDAMQGQFRAGTSTPVRDGSEPRLPTRTPPTPAGPEPVKHFVFPRFMPEGMMSLGRPAP